MKTLVISIKSPSDVLEDFKKSYKLAMKVVRRKGPHFEISFDTRKSFEKFVKSIHVLSSILIFKPRSVSEIAKITGIDVSNLNKIIGFYEEVGALKIQKKKVNGREVNIPLVEYEEIKFDLKAA